MTSDDSGTPRPDIVSDEDWKERVKSEDAAMDETFRQKEQTPPASGAETEPAGEEPATEEPATEEPATEESTPAEESSPTAASEAESTAEPPPLPPADFSTLVAMFSTQAMVALGIIPHPASGKPEPQPELARHFIDLLGVVESKTQGNLDAAEQTLLDNSLHELRMAFVEQSKVEQSQTAL